MLSAIYNAAYFDDAALTITASSTSPTESAPQTAPGYDATTLSAMAISLSADPNPKVAYGARRSGPAPASTRPGNPSNEGAATGGSLGSTVRTSHRLTAADREIDQLADDWTPEEIAIVDWE